MLKKLRFSTMFTLISALFLVACSSNETGPAKENKKQDLAGDEAKLQGELIISAAASLTDAAEEIKAAFNKTYPNVTVTYNFGGSGNLAQQIQHGAPADIFLSASTKDMNKVDDLGLLVKESRFDFASNALVLVTKADNDMTMAALEDIATTEFAHFVMGDPEAVPAGRYGKAAFTSIGVWDKIEGKMVYVSDVRQVLTQVETGNADIGLVFSTDAKATDAVKVLVNVDHNLHDAVIYPAAIVAISTNQEAAQAYLDFLQGEEGKAILSSFGFVTK